MQDDSQTKYIPLGIFGTLSKNFRCNIARSSTLLKQVVLLIDMMGQAQINKHRPVRIILSPKHNVIQFNIAMEDALGMQIMHRPQQILHDRNHLLPLQSFPACQYAPQRLFVILLHYIDCVLCLVDSLQPTNALVFAFGQKLELPLKGFLNSWNITSPLPLADEK